MYGDDEEYDVTFEPDKLLRHGCLQNDRTLIELAIKRYADKWNEGLYGACEGGHLDLVKLMISKGADDWDGGGYYACKNNHLEIVKLMISKGAKERLRWLEIACTHYCKETVDFLLDLTLEIIPISAQLRKQKCDSCFASSFSPVHFLNAALIGACRGGHIDLINRLIKLGAKFWDEGLYNACRGGHLEIAQMMVELGASDFSNALGHACIGGHQHMVDFVLGHVDPATFSQETLNEAFTDACIGGNLDIVKLIIELGATDVNEGFEAVCKNKHTKVIELLIEKGAFNLINLDYGLRGAINGGHLDLAKFLIDKGARDNDEDGCIGDAIHSHNLDIVKLVIAMSDVWQYDDFWGYGWRESFRENFMQAIPLFIDKADVPKYESYPDHYFKVEFIPTRKLLHLIHYMAHMKNYANRRLWYNHIVRVAQNDALTYYCNHRALKTYLPVRTNDPRHKVLFNIIYATCCKDVAYFVVSFNHVTINKKYRI